MPMLLLLLLLLLLPEEEVEVADRIKNQRMNRDCGSCRPLNRVLAFDRTLMLLLLLLRLLLLLP